MNFLEHIEKLRADIRENDEFFDEVTHCLLGNLYQQCRGLDYQEVYSLLTNEYNLIRGKTFPTPHWRDYGDFIGNEFQAHMAERDAYQELIAKQDILKSLIDWLDRNPEEA
jgi:hypothetical protein